MNEWIKNAESRNISYHMLGNNNTCTVLEKCYTRCLKNAISCQITPLWHADLWELFYICDNALLFSIGI